MKKQKEPPVPSERAGTVRHEIVAVLDGQTLSAREISSLVGIREKEVYEHLEHILQSLQRHDRRLVVTPAVCRSCGFSFRKRERLRKPGRCPVCKSEEITDPLFGIAWKGEKAGS